MVKKPTLIIYVKYVSQYFQCSKCGVLQQGDKLPVDRWMPALDVLSLPNVNVSTNIPDGWSSNGYLNKGKGGRDFRCSSCK